MLLCELEKMHISAPECGQLLAYTRDKVYFQRYSNLREVVQLLSNKDLLELHLFDDDREYRCIATRSRRYRRKQTSLSIKDPGSSYLQGVIETLVDFSEDEAYQYSSLLCTEDKTEEYNMLTILNHISYDPENGMAYIDNYRLKVGGK